MRLPLIAFIVIMLGFANTGCGNDDETSAATGTGGSLQIEDVVVGTGAVAAAGQTITVHYVGTLTDGTKFDSSRDRGTPFSFNLGTGQVIRGWDQGLPGMKVGGTRKLTIPATLGYGAAGAPPSIPGNATLIFNIELLSIP